LLLQTFLYAYNLDKHQMMHSTCGRNERIHLRISVILWLSVNLEARCSL
jgi:hypothetical protein